MTIELTKPGVLLTPRDYSILENLYHCTVMSFSQIKEKHFSLIGKATAVNRLTKLQEASLISKKRLPRFIQTSTDLQISTVYQITKDGIRELQKRHVDKVLRQEPVALNAFSIDHDLLLNEVMDKLHLNLSGSKIINGKLIDKSANGILPDAVCTYQDNQIAIELELSLKSESRYRELILKYRMARE